MDPTLAKIFGFDEEGLTANRSGEFHPRQVAFLLSSPTFQAALNLFVALSGVAYLGWSLSTSRPMGFVAPIAILSTVLAIIGVISHLKQARQFKKEAPQLTVETATGPLQLEQLTAKKQRGRAARSVWVGEEEFQVTKGVFQVLETADGQNMRVHWCIEPVHQRKHILSAEFVPCQ